MSNGIYHETVEQIINRHLKQYPMIELKIDDNNYNIKLFVISNVNDISEEVRCLIPFAYFFNLTALRLTIQL